MEDQLRNAMRQGTALVTVTPWQFLSTQHHTSLPLNCSHRIVPSPAQVEKRYHLNPVDYLQTIKWSLGRHVGACLLNLADLKRRLIAACSALQQHVIDEAIASDSLYGQRADADCLSLAQVGLYSSSSQLSTSQPLSPSSLRSGSCLRYHHRHNEWVNEWRTDSQTAPSHWWLCMRQCLRPLYHSMCGAVRFLCDWGMCITWFLLAICNDLFACFV